MVLPIHKPQECCDGCLGKVLKGIHCPCACLPSCSGTGQQEGEETFGSPKDKEGTGGGFEGGKGSGVLAEGEDKDEVRYNYSHRKQTALTVSHLMLVGDCSATLYSACFNAMSVQTVKGKEKSSDVKIQKVCGALGEGWK